MTSTQLTLLPLSQRYRALAGAGILAGALVVAAVLAAGISTEAFVGLGLALVALIGLMAIWWPRAAIVMVVLSPVLDRYVVGDLLPAHVATAAHYLSEGLLLAVGLVVAVRAALDGRLLPVLRSPVTAALLVFAALGAVSAVVNGVAPTVALVGLVFTLDAVALFFVPRLARYSVRQALVAVGAIMAVVVAAAVIAIGQALLRPDILGLEAIRGRFGDTARLGSIFGDPNVFGAFVVLATPFALIAAVRWSRPRARVLAGLVAVILILALWLSLSRGAWIAMVLGVGTALLIVDRRALLAGMLMCLVTFVVADTMPRDLLRPAPRPQLLDSTIDRFGTVGLGGDLRTLFVINALPIVRDHPLVGVGPGRYGGAVADAFGTPIYAEYDTLPLFWNPAQRTVDNFWLHLLVESGVLGLGAFLAAALIPGLRILNAARHSVGWRHILLGGTAAATAGMAVSAVTTMLLEANSIGFPFWFLLSLGAMVAAEEGVRVGRRTAGES